MDCSRFEERLSDYIEGQLAQPEASHFAAHLLRCRTCRQLLDDVKAALGECKARGEVETSDALASSLVRIPSEHRPLDCRAYEELITEFLDGYVPAPVYHRFEAHAAHCAGCSDLLTGVVYAVAACHLVHTYEDYPVPETLLEKLRALLPARPKGIASRFTDAAITLAGGLLPRSTAGARWSFATASMLTFASFALLLLGFSDDRTVAGVYRKAHMKAAELYSQGADIYAQKHEVVAELQRIGSDVGELWDTLGGEAQPPAESRGAQENRGVQENGGTRSEQPKPEQSETTPPESKQSL